MNLRLDKTAVWGIFAFLGLIAFTNLWIADEPDMSVYRFDSVSYLEIAKHAPILPAQIDISRGYPDMAPERAATAQIPFQHAQRFTFPYLVGLFAKFTSIDPLAIFSVLNFFLLAATACLVFATMRAMGHQTGLSFFLACLYLANPFVTRFYFVVPPYLGDVVFHFCLALLALGIVREKISLVFVALVFGILGRQTMLMVIPGLLFCQFTSFRGRKAIIAGILFLSIVLLGYTLTGRLASGMNSHSRNLEHMLGLFIWLSGKTVDGLTRQETGIVDSARALLSFIFRAVFSVLPVLAIFMAALLRQGKKSGQNFINRQTAVFTLMALGIVAQPVLAGPVLTGDTIVRLVALAYVPLIILTGLLLKRAGIGKGALAGLVTALFAASFHHRYTFVATLSFREQLFSGAVVVASLFLFAYFWRAGNPSREIP